MNSLAGVLIRFRREDVAAMCDVEQMFHSFHVSPEHRDFLRFLWFKENDLSKPVTEFRMTVHLFGNGPSPAVATYGLRRTVDDGGEHDPGVKEFVQRNFYVDDGLVSKPTAEEVVTLVRNTQAALASANLRLHKVVSNSVSVMEAFPTEDLAKDIRSLDLRQDNLPAQRSLGVFWDLETDAFTYKVSIPDKPLTRRGVLSVVNSVYDPLGLAAPVLLHGRLLCNNWCPWARRKRPQYHWDGTTLFRKNFHWAGKAGKMHSQTCRTSRYGDATTHRNLVQLPEPITRIFRCKPKSHRCCCLSSPIQLQRRTFCIPRVRPGQSSANQPYQHPTA